PSPERDRARAAHCEPLSSNPACVRASLPAASRSTLPSSPPLPRLSPFAALYHPLPPSIHHPPDAPGGVVGDVKRSVRSLGHPHRPVLGHVLVGMPEAFGERLVRSPGLAVLERDEHHAVAGLRQGSPVPGSVERNEGAAAVALGELRARVEDEPVRRPVRRERDGRLLLLRAGSDASAVAAVLGSEHEVAELDVVVAVRPSEVVALVDGKELLRWLLGALLQAVEFRPVLAELVAAVLRRPQLAVRR